MTCSENEVTTSPGSGSINTCTGCNVCVQECDFLQRSGNPKELANGVKGYDPFECTLCGLCAAVCPCGVDPAAYFLQRRREVRSQKGSDDPRHAPLIAYESRGTSGPFTFYGLPEQCEVVFFPGCALPGTRPHLVSRVYQELRGKIPNLGIVLDCCLKPSHDLGRADHFRDSFHELTSYLLHNGVKKVLVACPNCLKIFSEYGGDLSVETVYEVLAALPGHRGNLSACAVFHDPCVSRQNLPVHDAVRQLAMRCGLSVEEMQHSRQTTSCCGRGGGANFIRPGTVADAATSRAVEAAGRPIVTYCAACAETFRKQAATVHVLDLWFTPQEAWAGKAKVSRAPVTYLNRLVLKARLRKSGDFKKMHERGGKELTNNGGKKVMTAALLLLLVAAAVLLRVVGVGGFLEPEALKLMVQHHGVLGPLLFILLYGVTAVLFLPGLPMAIAAGILFGPFWGVVYAIIGATLGASISFLVARHLARDWVEARLHGEMWKNLDQKVGEQGWKIVAITRLVPLFPFNLLNYAYGLTKIPFTHYVLASFFGMLPACIAFIVFSSSLPQLLEGKISPSLVIGTLLTATVLFIPAWYRKKAQN